MRESEGSGRDGDDEGDRGLRREVLAYALVEHPLPLTIDELSAYLGSSVAVAAIERAVATLVEFELIVRDGELLSPSPAALRYNEIEPIEPPPS